MASLASLPLDKFLLLSLYLPLSLLKSLFALVKHMSLTTMDFIPGAFGDPGHLKSRSIDGPTGPCWCGRQGDPGGQGSGSASGWMVGRQCPPGVGEYLEPALSGGGRSFHLLRHFRFVLGVYLFDLVEASLMGFLPEVCGDQPGLAEVKLERGHHFVCGEVLE